jgi:hypothetical protein
MNAKVKVLPEIWSYFNDLIDILYYNDYLGFEEDAYEYVDTLFADIQENLSAKTRKPAPEFFDRYGSNMFYASFKKSRHTMWYVFFTIDYDEVEDTQVFLIRYVSNNHVVAKCFLPDP